MLNSGWEKHKTQRSEDDDERAGVTIDSHTSDQRSSKMELPPQEATTASAPSLPHNLHDLKRPALLTLCRIWNVKASGKVRSGGLASRDATEDATQANSLTRRTQNTDLVYRLQAAAANQGDDGDESSESGESDADDRDSSMSTTTPETTATIATTTSTLPRSPAFSTFQNLPRCEDTPSGGKRAREESPQDHVDHVLPQRPTQPLKSRCTMAATQHGPLTASPTHARKMAPLPRKSVLPTIKMALQSGCPSPTREALGEGKTTWSSSEEEDANGGLYPALPSPTRVPQFTFTCSPTARESPREKPLPALPASPTRSLTSSATSSVLAQLNARLAASGHAPASLTSSSSKPHSLHHSASAASLLRAKASNQSLSSSTSQRFDAAHTNDWSRQGGIDSHWSMKRYRSQGNLKDAAEGQQPQQPVAKKIRRDPEGSELAQASTSPQRPHAGTPAAKALEQPPAATSALAKKPSPTTNAPSLAHRAKQRIASGPRPSLLSSRKSKARSSLSAARMGRKSLVGGGNKENGGSASVISKKAPSRMLPSVPRIPSVALGGKGKGKPVEGAACSSTASSSTQVRPRVVSRAVPPTVSTTTHTAPSSASATHAPQRRFFAFGATTMKNGKDKTRDQQHQTSCNDKALPLSPSKTNNLNVATTARPPSPTKATKAVPTPAPTSTPQSNALRVAQARKRAAEESRRRMKVMQQQRAGGGSTGVKAA